MHTREHPFDLAVFSGNFFSSTLVFMNTRSGNAGGAAESSSKTSKKTKANHMPLERVLQISVAQHDARMTYTLVQSVVPEVSPFEADWINDEVTALFYIFYCAFRIA